MPATDSGTAAAHTPMVVPTSNRVNGSSTTSRMMNGMERNTLTTVPITRFSPRNGYRSPGPVVTSTSASTMPSTPDTSADTPTICRVCQKASR